VNEHLAMGYVEVTPRPTAKPPGPTNTDASGPPGKGANRAIRAAWHARSRDRLETASARVPRVPSTYDTEADIQDKDDAAGEGPTASRSAQPESGSNPGEGSPTKRRRGRRGGRGRSKKTDADTASENGARETAPPDSSPRDEDEAPRKRTRRRRTKKPEAAPAEGATPDADTSEKEAAPRKRTRRRRSKTEETAASEPVTAEEPEKATRKRTRRRRRSSDEATTETPGAEREPSEEQAPPKRTRRRRKTAEEPAAERADERSREEPADSGETRRRRRRRSGGTRAAADAEREAHPEARERRAPRKRTRRDDAREAPRSRPRRGGPPRARSIEDYFDDERLYACQRAVNYHFRDLTLLENALTHSSVKSADRPSYERLEFLGDSVVGLVVANYLYDLKPDFDEGELTKVKSDVVSTDGLADAAKACGLDQFLAVGRGIQMRDGPPKSLIADVFEAVVGAIYLDRGYEAVRLYVLDHLRPFIAEALSERSARNFKSVLQQVAQREFRETPRYEVVRRSGPDHSRTYEVLAVLGHRRYKSARGATKKEAEQAAAKRALQTILRDKMRSGGGGRSGGRRRRRSRGSSSSS
jgi:ribonuclease-3